MFVKNGSVPAVVLMLACIGLALALNVVREEQAVPVKETVSIGKLCLAKDVAEPHARFLEPANYGVRKKKFTIGTGGVGTFFRAWRNCIDEDKSLATTDSEEEQHAIERLVARQDTEYWIAATNLGSGTPELTWITTDLVVKTTPRNFNQVPDTCVSVDPDGIWKNNDCFNISIVLPYICEEYF
ncbi:AGAP004810-PA-like protein [Anopheles sinensis]|uniref:AGAP004810-PA-like protein n=1 Tax=Anopheles sinensis TaxID=74873 RepID=A0A084VUA9_ANOSI|nr:AGAP004810-PA-like protein [Anopheles sinensis]